jgi:hypothetical protein
MISPSIDDRKHRQIITIIGHHVLEEAQHPYKLAYKSGSIETNIKKRGAFAPPYLTGTGLRKKE